MTIGAKHNASDVNPFAGTIDRFVGADMCEIAFDAKETRIDSRRYLAPEFEFSSQK
jgi:hypothetical protein